MSNIKVKLFFAVIFITCFRLINDSIRIVHFIDKKYTHSINDIYSLGIGLVFIALLAWSVKQKVWRIGCSSIGISKILSFFSGYTDTNIGLILLILGICVILFGAINFYISFKREDFILQFNSEKASAWEKFIFSSLLIVILILIFIIYSL